MDHINSCIKKILKQRLRIAVAESCTGGLLSSIITQSQGASAIFDRGFVTYTEQAKVEMLGVNRQTLQRFGAISAQTAEEMVQGVLKNSKAHVGIAITGIAGPKTAENKPLGLVYIALQQQGKKATIAEYIFSGDRKTIRQNAVDKALALLYVMP